MRIPSQAAEPTILDLLTLEKIDRDLYRTTVVLDQPFRLYGGQVAAQALRAAGDTVPADCAPHSLHGYYLRGGDAARPTILRVDRDRDGRSFHARRVIAVQDGEVIFNMSASFHAPEPGEDHQEHQAPGAPEPEGLESWFPQPELLSMDSRVPPQPYPGWAWPTRLWARCLADLPDDDLVHACVLTYLSDASTGLSAVEQAAARCGPSLDHAVWFHRRVRLDEWVLMDLLPQTIAGGRGWYTGTIHTRDGVLAASLTQEHLFRIPAGPGRSLIATPDAPGPDRPAETSSAQRTRRYIAK